MISTISKRFTIEPSTLKHMHFYCPQIRPTFWGVIAHVLSKWYVSFFVVFLIGLLFSKTMLLGVSTIFLLALWVNHRLEIKRNIFKTVCAAYFMKYLFRFGYSTVFTQGYIKKMDECLESLDDELLTFININTPKDSRILRSELALISDNMNTAVMSWRGEQEEKNMYKLLSNKFTARSWRDFCNYNRDTYLRD